jgi:hypothetical protein
LKRVAVEVGHGDGTSARARRTDRASVRKAALPVIDIDIALPMITMGNDQVDESIVIEISGRDRCRRFDGKSLAPRKVAVAIIETDVALLSAGLRFATTISGRASLVRSTTMTFLVAHWASPNVPEDFVLEETQGISITGILVSNGFVERDDSLTTDVRADAYHAYEIFE